MDVKDDCESTDVAIVGCGPTGALLSALLGTFGIPNIVLEREAAITEDPRGISLDEDGIRQLQAVGIYDKVYSEIGSSIGYANFIQGEDGLHSQPFFRINLGSTAGATGHVGAIVHRQPIMEKNLRLAIANQASSQIRVSCTVTGIEEDSENVYCHYSDASGGQRSIRAKFLVGADGKTGFTRKKYLEPRGILLERSSRFHYQEMWVALNWRISLPTKETHPDFPLWKKGYTPEEVYDLFFPKDFRFICSPIRPAVCGRFGTGVERLWRFEFVVQKGEDGVEMSSREKTMEIILPYLTHPGSKYGLSVPNVLFPADCIEVLRSRPFTFSARSCNKWSMGRVILAGDAAHVFPPFGGQGIASGFRDSSSLAWRLAIVCRENTDNYEHLLSGWYRERKQQLERSLAATVENGKLCTEGNTWKFFILKLVLRVIQLVPAWKQWVELGPRRSGLIRYQWQEGLPFCPNHVGGVGLPQVYCTPVDFSSSDTEVIFSDDVIFRKGKVGMLQILVLIDSLSELDEARLSLQKVEKFSGGYVIAEEATYIIQGTEPQKYHDTGVDVFRLATPAEFHSSPLCHGRAEPELYDMFKLKKELRSKRFAIARPDRFVYAACDTRDELEWICGGIHQNLGLL